MKMRLMTIGLCCSSALNVQAQVTISNPGRVVERNVEYRANSKIDQGINKGLDKIEDGVMGIFKKKDKSKAPQTPQSTNPPTDNPNDSQVNNSGNPTDTPNRAGGSTDNRSDNANAAVSKTPASLKSYSKFDFVPGEKVIAIEDFMQDAIGDFPAKWNSSGSGEVVTIDGKPGHWLMLSKQGEYLPEFINSLPENFTLQFDLAANEKFSFYSTYLFVNMVAMANPAKEFTKWGRFPQPTDGVRVGLHPQNAGSSGQTGITQFITYTKGDELMKNETDQRAFNTTNHNVVKVSMWRQKQRLRVYVDETKIWDIPRAFQPGVTYNGVVLSTADMHNDLDRYYVGNLRLAIGAPDTRNKLLTEGKFVTHGILFDTNSDKIKPESYGALKDIANVLTENADVKVRIVGHTDSDGDDASNLALSQKRALAVKTELVATFGLDGSRMETDGKGESQPAEPNTSATGKANNRRVEFIKL